MDNSIISQIIEKGGTISWHNKYFLDFIEKWNTNPDKEWSGYEITEMTDKGLHTIQKSMKISEILEYFNYLIDEDARNKFINEWQNKKLLL